MTYLLPVIAAVGLWWFTTGVIIAVYERERPVQRVLFGAVTLLLIGSLVGVFLTRGITSPLYTYLAVLFGVLIWAWQVASYYLGFITGPPLPKPSTWNLSLAARFRLALRFSIHHEVLALAFGGLIALLTAGSPNRWALWIYLALWLMHASAKLNVFLGVRNFRGDLLPNEMRVLEGLLNKRPHNEFFPFSVLAASTAVLVLVYHAIEPGAEAHQTAGFMLVGTMIALGLFEHWLLVLPIPATIWGFRMVASEGPALHEVSTAAPAMTTAPAQREKRELTFRREDGPLIVDVWEAQHPADVPPILLIHGWGGTGSYWRETAFDLATTARVIVPDLPGTGRSQPVTRTLSMYDQVDALAYVIDELVEGQVQVVGHSMGGAMAMLLAERRPQQVERIMLTSLCLFMNDAQRRAFNVSMAVFRVTMNFRWLWLAEVPGMPQLMALQYFHKIPSDQEVLRRGLLDYLKLDRATALECASNSVDVTIPEAAAKVHVPTLLVACREDRVMPTQNVAYTAEVIPDCDVRWIEACGHLPMVEKPDEYQAILHEFLRI